MKVLDISTKLHALAAVTSGNLETRSDFLDADKRDILKE